MNRILRQLLLLQFVAFLSIHLNALPLSDSIFKNPPSETKPRTWFHSMSSNLSKPGITKDLESLAEVGVGGATLFNVHQLMPLGNVPFASEEHFKLVKHMAEESQRLGLGFGVHNSEGWSSSAGPWITPDESMKKVVWSESIVEGGAVSMALPSPPKIHDYYRDIAVLAYPSFPAEVAHRNATYKVFADGTRKALPELTDGSTVEAIPVQGAIIIEFNKKSTLRSLKLFLHEARGVKASLQVASDSGDTFKDVVKLSQKRSGKREYVFEDTFEAQTAKRFRIRFHDADKIWNLKELDLSPIARMPNTMARVNRVKKASHHYKYLNPDKADTNFILRSKDLVNLTSRMNKAGQLNAKLPAGTWTILRFGYTTTGATNVPTSPVTRGLEVDKFQKGPLKKHYDAYVGKIAKMVASTAPDAYDHATIDSYEVGGQNWTEGYEKLFEKRHGYSLIPYLPLFTGRYVESAALSDKVLFEVRELNNELVLKNYYEYFTELANADGLASYVEPYGSGPFSQIDAGAKADVPMGEFWYKREKFRVAKARASANLYGKKKVATESFTALPNVNWSFKPSDAKTAGDEVWTRGVNDFYFHRFAHQPNTHVVPGMLMGQWGAHFDRTQPWWESAGAAWFKYMARGQYLLRLGHSVADVLMFMGDVHPHECSDREQFKIPLPRGVNYDCLNQDTLQNGLSASDGRMILKTTGAPYRVLWLPDVRLISLTTLEKIASFANENVVIVGEAPQGLLSRPLTSPKDQKRFEELRSQIWSKPTTLASLENWRKVFDRFDILPAFRVNSELDHAYIQRDVDGQQIFFTYNASDREQDYSVKVSVKGKAPEIWNPVTGEAKKLGMYKNTKAGIEFPLTLLPGESTFIVFREASSQAARLTHLKSPKAKPSKIFKQNNAIVFQARDKGAYTLAFSNGEKRAISLSVLPKTMDLSKNWNVKFNEAYFFDKRLKFAKLVDWSQHPNPEVRHYSGTARYTRKFKLSYKQVEKGIGAVLDLGQVEYAAKVWINGKLVAVSWTVPHRLDITDHVKTGSNTLEIEVANGWRNKLIAEEALPRTDGYVLADWEPLQDQRMPAWFTNNEPLPPGKRKTFAAKSFVSAGDPLEPAGLIGPVQIQFYREFTIAIPK